MHEVSHQIDLFELRWLLNVKEGQIFGSYIFLILQLILNTGQHVEFCSPMQKVQLSRIQKKSAAVGLDHSSVLCGIFRFKAILCSTVFLRCLAVAAR